MNDTASNQLRSLWLQNARVWLTLLLLLALSVILAFTPMDRLNTAANLAIAAVMAAIAIIDFMGLRGESPLLRLVAAGGFFWLVIMFSLTLSDYFTRFN